MGNVDITLSEAGGEDGAIIDSGLEYTDVMPGDKFQKTVTIKIMGMTHTSEPLLQ